MSYPYRIANTAEITQLAAIAKERNYNRQLDQHFLDLLAPEGSHVCYFHMPHEHAEGTPVAVHIRGLWLMAVTYTVEPIKRQLDCDMEIFNKLPILERGAA